MIRRRTVIAALAMAAPAGAFAANGRPSTAYYNAVGPNLAWWRADTGGASLTKMGSVALPALVQYVWRHPRLPVLYVASSNFVPMDKPDGKHHLTAFRIDPATGALSPLGISIPIKARPIHMSVDLAGKYILTAYNIPSSMSVHTINPDGAIGAEVKQTATIDGGIYAHQIRMFPSNNALILVSRGNNATAAKPEDPGSLKVKRFKGGQVTDVASVTPPSGGLGFGPRHIDFHPTKPWLFVSVERQNQLQVWRTTGDTLATPPLHVVPTLAEPANLRPEQMVGPIHIHPNGRFVYVANRASGLVEADGKKVAAGGENTIAVFKIDPVSGKPEAIQSIDTNGYHPRTFSIDPSGKMLAVANLLAMAQRDGSTRPATVSTYRIGPTGKLDHVHTIDIETNGLTQWWSGFIAL